MKNHRIWLAVVVAAALVRLATLNAYPLHDTTEARYAEIARLMVVSSDWITPQIEPGVPFWAKPPLSTWLTAISFSAFGINEFAARLPALLMIGLTGVLVFRVGRSWYSGTAGLIASAILASSGLGFIAAGAVMTDAALVSATTLSLASFCETIKEDGARNRYGLFVGAGLGLLAKGPVAIVLTGLPILAWSLWQKDLGWLWRSMPWIRGSVISLAIAVPWYLLAELKSPGFLEYFLIGEHWLRFVDSGWPGDLYGHAHAEPRGTIWLFGIAAALPWSIVGFYRAIRWLVSDEARPLPEPRSAFLLLWMLTPLVFFSFAGNILPAYVLPGMPALALLLGRWLSTRPSLTATPGFLVPGAFAAAAALGFLQSVDHRSQRDLVQYHREHRPGHDLVYYPSAPHSAAFYSRGTVRSIGSEAMLRQHVQLGNDGDLAVRKKHLALLPESISNCISPLARIHDYVVMQPKPDC